MAVLKHDKKDKAETAAHFKTCLSILTYTYILTNLIMMISEEIVQFMYSVQQNNYQGVNNANFYTVLINYVHQAVSSIPLLF
ncbi:hypothetical protein Ciccas_001243 [Cichlidogyrus casuarinus]|uniref:Uncharacterized protein n=1 Tax=Cichlidogyrus casuarinus TaxID=1844966 RepID=A0ABD2QKL9_9PLAT